MDIKIFTAQSYGKADPIYWSNNRWYLYHSFWRCYICDDATSEWAEGEEQFGSVLLQSASSSNCFPMNETATHEVLYIAYKIAQKYG